MDIMARCPHCNDEIEAKVEDLLDRGSRHYKMKRRRYVCPECEAILGFSEYYAKN